jgi:hypothetical protein
MLGIALQLELLGLVPGPSSRVLRPGGLHGRIRQRRSAARCEGRHGDLCVAVRPRPRSTEPQVVKAATTLSPRRKGGFVPWHARLGMLVEETRGHGVLDERVVGEPLDRAALGAYVAEGVPGRQQLRVLLVQLVLEPAEGAVAPQSLLQSPRIPTPETTPWTTTHQCVRVAERRSARRSTSLAITPLAVNSGRRFTRFVEAGDVTRSSGFQKLCAGSTIYCRIGHIAAVVVR